MPLIAASQSYGCPLCPRAISTSQATITVRISASPATAVAFRSIWAKRSSRPVVRPRIVSLCPVSSRMTRPNAVMTTSPNTPLLSWPPSQLATSTTTPSARQNAGMNHFERTTAGLRFLIIEHLLDRGAKITGQRQRQRERGGVALVLDRVDRLPRHPHRLRQLPLRQVPSCPQRAHPILHRLRAASPGRALPPWQAPAISARPPGRDHHGRQPADRDDGFPAALPDRLHDRADRHDRHSAGGDHIHPPRPWLHDGPPSCQVCLS